MKNNRSTGSNEDSSEFSGIIQDEEIPLSSWSSTIYEIGSRVLDDRIDNNTTLIESSMNEGQEITASSSKKYVMYCQTQNTINNDNDLMHIECQVTPEETYPPHRIPTTPPPESSRRVLATITRESFNDENIRKTLEENNSSSSRSNFFKSSLKSSFRSLNSLVHEILSKDVILKEGWAWKLKEGVDKSYQRRYFVLLKNGQLEFYNNVISKIINETETPCEAFDITQYALTSACGLINPKGFEIEILHNNGSISNTLHIETKTVTEKLKWLKLIFNIIIERSKRIFNLDSYIYAAIESTAYNQLTQVRRYVAPFLQQELMSKRLKQILIHIPNAAITS